MSSRGLYSSLKGNMVPTVLVCWFLQNLFAYKSTLVEEIENMQYTQNTLKNQHTVTDMPSKPTYQETGIRSWLTLHHVFLNPYAGTGSGTGVPWYRVWEDCRAIAW
jgi:hypothetical protein